MATQSVRLQLKDGGEVEVASVAVAQTRYPDAKIIHVTTFDKDGTPTTEPYRAVKASKAKSEPTPSATVSDMPATVPAEAKD